MSPCKLPFFSVARVLLPALLLVSNVLVIPITRAQDDDYTLEVTKANDLLRRRRYEDALKGYKRANELREKKSVEALLGMAQAYYGLEAYKNVVETAERVVLLSSTPNDLARAYNLEGLALQTQAGVKDQKKLQDAEAAFRKGLTTGANFPILSYNLGFTLLEQGRDAEGIAELKKYAQTEPDGAKAAEAAKLIENPRRAREAYAPDFSFTSSDGEYISLDDLKGKVVLLDFWGTWCPPCVASVPALRDLQRRFAKEPLFRMISVSNDSDELKWRGFVEKNGMAWTQYLDRDRHLVRAFDVRAFPTYILIDAEGIVRFREISSRWETSGDLPDAIKKHLKLAGKINAAE
jgi:peroxiredoxin